MKDYLEPIETKEGSGELVSADGGTLHVGYRVEFRREMTIPRPGAQAVPGLKQVSGYVETEEPYQLDALEGHECELRLQDGATLPVLILSCTSATIAGITAAGEYRPADS